MKDDSIKIKGDLPKMYGFKKSTRESRNISYDCFSKKHKDQMIDNFHKIVNTDCYGVQKKVIK